MRSHVGDLRQLASVRRIVLDDGPERGVRGLAFSTGGGLDFWALTDRSLDIGPLAWRGSPLAWASPAGFRSPYLHDPEADGGRGFARSLSGFLVTCGLDHVRQPRAGHPLHGRLPFTPARLLAYGEDWDRATPVLFAEGEVVQARQGGEALRLRRRIEAPVGGITLSIRDTVENIGSEPWPQALLYHFNLGFPAIADGTEVRLGHDLLLGPIRLPDANDRPGSTCFNAGRDARACCTVQTPSDSADGFTLSLGFGTTDLPHLQIWHDLRPRVGVLAIEPCTSARLADATSGPERSLLPGERRHFELDFTFAGTPPAMLMRNAASTESSIER